MPLFEPLSMEKQHLYLGRLQESSIQASDYSFINLWGWAEEYGLLWAWQDDLVWIKQTRPGPCYWAPVGLWETIDWDSALADLEDDQPIFTRAPPPLITVWESFGQRLNISQSRAHWDYLYKVEDLVKLKGKPFQKKRNLLNQFNRKYSSTFIPFKPDLVDQTLEMQRLWCFWRDCESSDMLSAENRVIERVFDSWDALEHITGGVIFVEEDMVAFTIAEKFCADTLIIHFEKGLVSYTGVYQAINQMFLDSMDGYIIVNRQQDLDDEGLRKAKLSYNPIGFIEKYQVSFRKTPGE
jgi:hypothetical protein